MHCLLDHIWDGQNNFAMDMEGLVVMHDTEKLWN